MPAGGEQDHARRQAAEKSFASGHFSYVKVPGAPPIVLDKREAIFDDAAGGEEQTVAGGIGRQFWNSWIAKIARKG
jgi:hypothetical protein